MIAVASFNDVLAYLLGQKTCLLANPPDLPFLTTYPIMLTEADLRVVGAASLEMIKRSINPSSRRLSDKWTRLNSSWNITEIIKGV